MPVIPAVAKSAPATKVAKPIIEAKTEPSKPPEPAAVKPVVAELPLDLIRQAIEEESDENTWAHLGAVGHYLTKIRPDFDSRLYGYKKLSDLFKQNAKYFSVEERAVAGTSSKVFYVKVV